MKSWYQSKTVQVGLATFAGGLCDMLLNGGLDALLAGQWRSLAIMAIGVVMVVLRTVTKVPLGTPPEGR